MEFGPNRASKYGDNLFINSAGFEKDIIFRDKLHEVVLEMAAKLKVGEIPSLHALLDPIAKVRNEVANIMMEEDPHFFGMSRVSLDLSARTAIMMRYRSFKYRAHDLIKSSSEEGRFVRRESLPGSSNMIELTAIVAMQPVGSFDWIHTSHLNIDPILKAMEILFQHYLLPDLSKKEVLELVARIHWWLAHAMPYARGSASIVDAATKAMLYAKEIYPGSWKPGIIPDIQAFHIDLETFVKMYPFYFEQS